MKVKYATIKFVKDYQDIKKGTLGKILTGVGNFYKIKILKTGNIYENVPNVFVKRI